MRNWPTSARMNTSTTTNEASARGFKTRSRPWARSGPMSRKPRSVASRGLGAVVERPVSRSRGIGPRLHEIWAIVHRCDPKAVLPEGADLRLLPARNRTTLELRQWGNRLTVGGPAPGGSPLALIRARQKAASELSRWMTSGNAASLRPGPRSGAGMNTVRG